MRSAVSLAVLLLAGCATPAPQLVRVPVPVPCVVELPPVPVITPDAELKAMSDYRLILTVARERLVLLGYSAEIRAAAEGCLAP